MDTKTVQRILQVQDVLREDPQYQHLYQEYLLYSKAFSRLMEEISPEHKAPLQDYLGDCCEMHIRMLEIACDEKTWMQDS